MRSTPRDPRLEDAERTLYRAARREVPDSLAHRKTLEALQRAALVSSATWDGASDEAPRAPASPGWRIAGWLAFAAAIALVTLALGARTPRRVARWPDVVAPVPAEPSPVAPSSFAVSEPDVPEAPVVPESLAATAVPVAPPAAPPSSARPRRTHAASLPDEIESLDRARAALAEHDPHRAIGVLDDYDRVLGGVRLRDEATLLRIEALEAAGRRPEAAALAHRFVANNPDSPLGDRALRLVGDEGAGSATPRETPP